ncbi:MOSC domain-containing protein [Curvibacter sp. RS43]|uniref:MOSC domain-containing protein n=1 Tax=Curvibacter microcysteis TaxID=3026419 RepID=UPI0023605B92|nr:MOSC domain-containing protein [Curvibacter sp. RS43]MDD0810966.1 MOSC domain-containing protein [Curvibacter sp. RS43]
MQVLSLNIGQVRPLQIAGRRVMSAIGKQPVSGAVAVGPLGLAGDEQADPSVHGGLEKAVYAWPTEHYAYWQAQRREQGVSLFDETLPPGFAGENLSLSGLLEQQVWVGDCLVFEHCVLRVTAAREPCGKFNAVMGFAQAAKRMLQSQRSGFYLAVQQPGTLRAGESFELRPGQRSLSIPQALLSKAARHRD